MPREKKSDDFDKRFNRFWSEFVSMQKAVYDIEYARLTDKEREALDSITILPEGTREMFPEHEQGIAKSFYTRFRKNPELLDRWFEISKDPTRLLDFLRDFDRERYFPSPTSSALVSPVFALGLGKDFDDIDVKDAYETTMTYLSVDYPQSKSSAQMRLFNTPDERLYELQRAFRNSLSPYGLKILYLVIEECDQNNRQNSFVIDSNRCLDLLGHEKTKQGYHRHKNRKRLLGEIESLTKINFNVERRSPHEKKKGKDKALRFVAPLLSITGKFEEFLVDEGEPIETGIKINESMRIYLNDEFYSDIKRLYTFVPMEYLRIDTRSNPHAVMLYPYISNQWRIGWHQYHGLIKHNMRRLLEGAGLLGRLPKRANDQRNFINNIKDNLKWLKNQPAFWIKDVRFTSKNIPPLEQTVTIIMGDDHPLKTAMKGKKQIE